MRQVTQYTSKADKHVEQYTSKDVALVGKYTSIRVMGADRHGDCNTIVGLHEPMAQWLDGAIIFEARAMDSAIRAQRQELKFVRRAECVFDRGKAAPAVAG